MTASAIFNLIKLHHPDKLLRSAAGALPRRSRPPSLPPSHFPSNLSYGPARITFPRVALSFVIEHGDRKLVPRCYCTDQKVGSFGSGRDEDKDGYDKLLTLPTVLTIARVAAVPMLVGTFYADAPWAATSTTSIFIAASITDWLDGYLARKMKLGTAFGAFLDPVADKLMVAATLILLCSKPVEISMFGQLPWILTVPAVAIIGREITMSAVREWAASQDSKLLEAVAVNNLGKWKTATQMTALTLLLATRDTSLGAPDALVTAGVALLYTSAGLAVWSLIVYMKKIWKVLLK
ncbi:hypothetical protein MLD38_002600 [Melastoma candidum]|uniref:Uncharacterized protein n=1 Tax=Melastoma candidum TaxID=119954 RepID=A0ACB9S1E1_9MYRT|nr:hypothetical protein MLD38_002600 [Melastoma candidum]